MSSDRRAKIRRALRAGSKGERPEPSPGPNRAQRRGSVREARQFARLNRTVRNK